MLGVAAAALFGLGFGCTSNTNEPNVAGGTAAKAGPKDMKEFYEQNQMKTASKTGAAKSTPEAAPTK
jgi:hypothetical protein